MVQCPFCGLQSGRPASMALEKLSQEAHGGERGHLGKLREPEIGRRERGYGLGKREVVAAQQGEAQGYKHPDPGSPRIPIFCECLPLAGSSLRSMDS